jgi:hypothetical protein
VEVLREQQAAHHCGGCGCNHSTWIYPNAQPGLAWPGTTWTPPYTVTCGEPSSSTGGIGLSNQRYVQTATASGLS